MLHSYSIYSQHPNTPGNNIRRNSLNSTSCIIKPRRTSFSQPSTPLILAQTTFDDFTDNYFSSNVTDSTTLENKFIESQTNFVSEPKNDGTITFLDSLDLANNLISTNDDNSFINTNKNLSNSMSPMIPSSNIQCVRIIRRTDSAPVITKPVTNQPRVVRVIRVSNASRNSDVSSSTTSSPSNVYILRKNDIKPTVQINPAVKHVINRATNNNSDENNQINQFYGSTISIFGIEYSVVSNEETSEDKCASLVQNFPEPNTKVATSSTNKINDIHKLFSRIYRCVLCTAEFDVYEDFVAHGSGHLQDLRLKPLETASVFRRRSYRCLLPHCNTRIESETESPRILDQLFRRHLLSHVGSHPFKCHLCKSKFQRIQNYRVHLAFHEEINMPSFQCTKCSKKFSTEKQYNFHIRKCFVVQPSLPVTTSASSISFRCHICGENFEKDQSLSLHMKHIHTSRPTTPSVTAIRSDNEVRVRLVSPPPVPIKSKPATNQTNLCQICHEEFPKRLLYKKHMLTHLGDKHFACTYPGCKETFYTQSNLDRHVRTVHLRDSNLFTCTFPNCGKTFTRNDSLKTHRVKHFPNMILKCPYVDCEEKFRVRSTYHAHVKRHRTEKQQPSIIYVCVLQNCQYTTSNKASMKQHLTKIHDYQQGKDEDIPYIQYPSKHHQQQQQQQEQEQQQHQQQQQQITVDDPVLTNNNPIAVVSPPVDISAPHVVKLPSDEPMTTSSIVVPLQPPLVPVVTSEETIPQTSVPFLSSSDTFDFFKSTMMPNVFLGDLDWLNIESEENIRPRKRPNIITISRDMESLSTVVVENLSGCARTDYRSNHALLERVKFRRKLLNYKRELLKVDSQQVTSVNTRISTHVVDDPINDNDEDENNDDDDDILETTTWETSPKRMKRWLDVNEN